MDLGTALSVAQSMFTALQSSELREICSMLSYTSDLEKLQSSIETIKAVLLDAEAKKDYLTHEARLYIKKLNYAAYDADDMIDEFVTLAQQKKLIKGNKVRLSSLFKEMGVAYKMSRGVKKVRENLANIANDHTQFGLSINHQSIKKRRDETCSYIHANDIIGRDDDVDKIRGMLLDSNVQRNVSFLTITGMGGLGKTALAQLVYNNKEIKDKFPSRLWACVSDQDLGHLNLKEILHKILASATGKKHAHSTLDGLQHKVRMRLLKEKFLLVLDDVWTENRDEWLQLEGFLKGALEGSWVLVTTRSTKTANIIGMGLTHKLKGLSYDNSWRLFERTAFQEVKDEKDSRNLVEIGQKIIERCANVPLAIRAVGTLLYGQDETKWKRVLETGLANIMYEEKGIMPILKFSYDNLEPPIKSCFSYCALFPKDFVIQKDKLIRLWRAQGYIVPLEKGQSIEDAAEEYFLVLLRRCFFQDVEENDEGEIISCKIHDLMHDIALEVSEYEVCLMNSNTIHDLDERVRHVSVMNHDFFRSSNKKIRTYIQVQKYLGMDELLVRKLLGTSTCLRTLDLRWTKFKKLPESIGKLLHLRYLDLSYNDELEVIPKSITKLHNLIFLRILKCRNLTCLPLGIGKLRHLQTLERFMLGKASSNDKQLFHELEDLKALVNLRGVLKLEIRIPSDMSTVAEDWRRGAYLSDKELNTVQIFIEHTQSCLRLDFEETLLEKLCPPSNIKSFTLYGFNGLRMPSWGVKDTLCTFLPSVVRLHISECQRLQSLPWLGNLRHLESLSLFNLLNLEYVEDASNHVSYSAASLGEGKLAYFPCLKKLYLKALPKLKRWWSGSPSSPFLSQLRTCDIEDCPEMTSIPFSPCAETLEISDDKRFLYLESIKDTSSSSSPQWKLNTNNLRSLKLLPEKYMHFITKVFINNDNKVKSLSEVTELFQNFLTLRDLLIYRCPKLRSLCGGIEYISSLRRLWLEESYSLLSDNAENEEKDGIPWQHLAQKLDYLKWDMGNKNHLPEKLQYLTALPTLTISGSYQLKSLPNWMSKLTSLKHLEVWDCSHQFKERCQPTGEDWPLIRHISKVDIYTEWTE